MADTSSPYLILFDIDGTILLTGGRAGKLMIRSAAEETGMQFQYDVRNFIGSTDRRIIRLLLEQNGFPSSEIDPLIDRILERYTSRIREVLSGPDKIRVLPGVRELLERLSTDRRFALGLVTGNFRKAALAKLQPVGLDRYFPVGAFGDDAENRNDLPPIAIRRAEEHYGVSFSPENVWIVGDSPNDILCAHANGLRCLAVCSGFIPKEELLEFKPDALVDDLSDTEAIVSIFLQKCKVPRSVKDQPLSGR